MIKNILILAILFCTIIPGTANCQATEEAITKIDLQLKKGETTITKTLSNESLMYLHSLTKFREVIKANAKVEKNSLVTANEPGTKITVKGLVADKNAMPVKNLLIYVYHTSDKGWYSDTGVHIRLNEGDMRHARLFGYFKTNDKGEFSFETIKPRGYPASDLAAHIHIQYWSADLRPLYGPGELQFEDDERMTPARRKKSLEEGFLISKNSGTAQKPVYEYKIIVQ